jgi:hypothetical protein
MSRYACPDNLQSYMTEVSAPAWVILARQVEVLGPDKRHSLNFQVGVGHEANLTS